MRSCLSRKRSINDPKEVQIDVTGKPEDLSSHHFVNQTISITNRL